MARTVKKKVLFCILNWGLGHATRCIPIIHFLQKKGFSVSIASDGVALALLQKEFPNCHFSTLPSYNASYTVSPIIGTLLKLPRFFLCYLQERKIVERLSKTENYTAIISDNRYGCYSKSIPSYFISHQLNPFFFLPLLIQKIALPSFSQLINKFSACLLPDSPKIKLSGAMSKNCNITIPIIPIGLLSRFPTIKPNPKQNGIVAILSGPEPERTDFEKYIYNELKDTGIDFVLIRGTDKPPRFEGLINSRSIASSDEILSLIKTANFVLCRSGYTSLMDLFYLSKKAIVVPTKGMPEQEYLADIIKTHPNIIAITQIKGALKKALTCNQHQKEYAISQHSVKFDGKRILELLYEA